MKIPKTCPVCSSPVKVGTDDVARCTKCKAFAQPLNFHQEVTYWARRQTAWWHILLFIFLAYTTYKYFSDYNYSAQRLPNPINAMAFGVHEFGHMLFSFMGETMRVLGGSLLQVLMPIIAFFGFWQLGYFFGVAASLTWVGFNLMDVATYVADASQRVLPLVWDGVVENARDGHDWWRLLSQWNILHLDSNIAFWMRVSAGVLIGLGLAICAWMIYEMLYGRLHKQEREKEETKRLAVELSILPNSQGSKDSDNTDRPS